MLEEGKIDIGLVEGNAARPALDGIGRTQANLAVLSVMYPNPGMFAVLADSPNRQIEDLEGKPVAFGTRASGLQTLADRRARRRRPGAGTRLRTGDPREGR